MRDYQTVVLALNEPDAVCAHQVYGWYYEHIEIFFWNKNQQTLVSKTESEREDLNLRPHDAQLK